MYTLLRTLPIQQSVLEQVSALGVSLLIAEIFYKFGSFTLECLAFLATWFVIDLSIQGVRKLLQLGQGSADP